MSFGRAVKRRVKGALPPAFFLSLVAYFAWNANQGAHGLKSYSAQLRLLSEAQSGQAAANAEQAAWSQRVAGLRDRGLDVDTIDERARAMLNLADPGDIVVPYGQNNKLY
jgi:cell division protein FtsB